MRLSWNEIRSRAAAFASEWQGKGYERGETQTFYNDFFDVFGISRRRVASFEAPVRGLSENRRGYIDLFWKGILLVEQKSAGHDLKKAKEQAINYFPGLKDSELPRYILACDFQQFELWDLDAGGQPLRFGLYDLPKHVQAFAFMFGGVQRTFKQEDKVNIAASELMGELHDALKDAGYEGHPLERFLVRLVFCLFADDTGIFDSRGMLAEYIENRTQADGTDLGPKLERIFEVLNTPKEKRQKTLDEDLKEFPYVNGDLFGERLPLPDFNGRMRQILIDACNFDWTEISPAIFGALFQSVMDKKKRRAIGAHYTNEQNILKLIGPLFLDDLKAEFKSLKSKAGTTRREAFRRFHNKLRAINCFDPACGCGNFLIIAYRELRAIETEVIIELIGNNRAAFEGKNVTSLSLVDVDQMYGIEIEEFPSRIAETGLWMMDHIMNVRLSDRLGEAGARLPLKAVPTIRHGDALEIDWSTVLPPDKCSYVMGNPPFIGSKMQTLEQRAQVHRIADLKGKKGALDYVCCWFLKAGAYVQKSHARIGFVATNSITQGEQVAELWPLLFNRYHLEITYAHRTFAWGSEARGRANVHVVIIGLAKATDAPNNKRLFDYQDIKGDPTETSVRAVSPYLFDGSSLGDAHLVVAETSKPATGYPPIVIGSKPIDDGNFIFDPAERAALIAQEPQAEAFLHPYVGSEEFINGGERWILALQRASPSELRSLPSVMKRIDAVRTFRLASKSAGTRALARTPTMYHVNIIPEEPYLVVPKVSSERREYVPIGYMVPPTIPSDLLFVIENATAHLFALITSRMHMAWLRQIGGRLKSDYRYSIGLVYNPFPWPDLDDEDKKRIGALGEAVLAARAKHPTATLADLYDPSTMPANLRKAHDALDRAVDRLYRKEPFRSDRERVEFLLARYEKLTAPALALAAQKPKRGKKPSPEDA